MKYILPIALFFSPCVAEELESAYQQQESDIKVESDALDLKTSYGYKKVGGFVGNIHAGVGNRTIDWQSLRGNDVSFNLNVPNIRMYSVAPTVEYDRLFFKKPTANSSRYFGMGIEAGAFIGSYGPAIYPMINPKLIWGNERESGGFSQLSVNLIPAGIFAVSTVVAITNPSVGGGGALPIYLPSSVFGMAGVIASSPFVIDFTVSF